MVPSRRRGGQIKNWLGNNILGEENVDRAMKAAGQIIQWAEQAKVERLLN